MKRIKGFVKGNIKLFIGIVVGGMIFGGGVYAATVAANTVSYSNASSGITSTNVQGAIDELYEKADIRKYPNFVSAYTYNESSCITGEESTCVKSTCYKTATAGSCKAGDIIKYKVNDTDIITFHVMKDNGSTITMQSQKQIVYKTGWDSINSSGSGGGTTTDGPVTILPALENATEGWSNVKDQTYTLGTTSFSGLGQYTGCSAYNSCTSNRYTMVARTAKARLITVQEASNSSIGNCTTSNNSCRKWMINGILETTPFSPTMNADTSGRVWYVMKFVGGLYLNDPRTDSGAGAKAVVEVDK